jgi:hypothetical protein
VGDGVAENITEKGHLQDSTMAYRRIYPPIAEALTQGEKVWITIRDMA